MAAARQARLESAGNAPEARTPALAVKQTVRARDAGLMCLDGIIASASMAISFILRFDLGPTLEAFAPQLLAASAIALFLKPLVFLAVGLYAIYWRYASSREVLRLLGAVAAASLAILLCPAVLARSGVFRGIPLAILGIDFFVSGLTIASARLLIHLRLSRAREHSPLA